MRPWIAPPPPWVRPLSAPTSAEVPDAGAITLLLRDEQTRPERGGLAVYSRTVARIGSAQALPAAALHLPWDPALGTLVIHHWRALRDGRVIDLLGDGSRITVLRREENLEQAALDGMLTATGQPEDVRVGDIIDLAFTITRRDPAVPSRVEAQGIVLPGLPVARSHMRFLWPKDEPLAIKVHPGLPQPKRQDGPDGTEVIVAADNLTPPRPPRAAPARFTISNLVELTNARGWADIAATNRPLYDAAARIPPGSPLAAEVARIRAAHTDPAARAMAALKLVQDDVRYLALLLNGGGYRPAPATETWARRFGDCKAKTALLLGLLRELGIEAWPALVNARAGDALNVVLPRQSAFDHVLVQARIGGRVYWLDGTRTGDRALDRLEPPPVGYALPLTPGQPTLSKVEPRRLAAPEAAHRLDLDARAGIFAPAKAEGSVRMTGDAALVWRVALAQLPPAERERALKEYWRKEYSFITPEAVGSRDEPDGSFVLTLRGSAEMGWSGSPYRYETDGSRVGFRFNTRRDEELGRDAPFAIDYPHWQSWSQTILLPNNGAGFTLQGGALAQTLGAWVFDRKVMLVDGRVTLESATRTTAPEMAAADARRLEPAFRTLADDAVYVTAPRGYVPTAADMKVLAERPELPNASSYDARARLLGDGGRPDLAIKDLEAGLKLAPDRADLKGRLAFILSMEKGPNQRAEALAAEALATRPDDTNALTVQAAFAADRQQWSRAEELATKAISADQAFQRPRLIRAFARGNLNRPDDMDADLAVARRLGASVSTITYIRLRAAVSDADRLKVLDAAVAAEPADLELRRMRAEQRKSAGDKPGARADYSAVLAREPTAWVYIDRAQTFDAADRAGWTADLDAAAKLDPKSPRVPLARATMELRAKDYAAMERHIAAAEAIGGDDQPYVAQVKVQLLATAKRLPPGGEIAILEPFAKSGDAELLNALCWARATRNRELDRAEENCRAALESAPERPEFLDSLGLVQLRRGRAADAIVTYTRALDRAPAMAASLYGRALARIATGDRAGADADLAAARKTAPKVDDEFAGYGLKP